MTPERRRLLDPLLEAMRKEKPCPILQTLHIGCAANAVGATQAELDELVRELFAEEQARERRVP